MIRMNRLIINNKTNLSDLAVLGLVEKVVSAGRISNEGTQYCYATRIGSYMIVTDRGKDRDSFFIYEEKKDREPENEGE